MFVDGKLYMDSDTHNSLSISVDIFGDDQPDDLIMNALKTTNRSYCPAVTWDENRLCYHVEAQWDVDPDWGDDYMAVIRRLEQVVPRELISVRLERPNQPVHIEGALVDLDV